VVDVGSVRTEYTHYDMSGAETRELCRFGRKWCCFAVT